MNPRRVLLLINPLSRTGEASEKQVREEFQRLGLVVIPETAVSPKDFCARVHAHKHEVDLVVVAGGDGSVNAALPALLEAGLPLAVIPLGTSNNLARGLGIPLEIPGACALIAIGNPKKVDVATVNDIPFLVVAGMGVSIRVNREVKSHWKRLFGMFAYIFTALRIFQDYRPFKVEITTPHRSLCLRSLQLSVCNGKHFGSGLTVADDAVIDDGQLDLFCVTAKHWWQFPVLALALRKGTLEKHHPAFHLRATELTLTTNRPMSIDTDGEITTRTPAKLKVLPGALSVLV